MLYEGAKEMVEYVAQAMRQTSREATILLYAPALGSSSAEDSRAGRPGVLRDARSSGQKSGKSRAEDARGSGHTGGFLMSLWKQLVEPRRAVNPKVLELETAKEILAEVFHTRPADIEDMIQRRLEERDWSEENREKLWPASFCLGD